MGALGSRVAALGAASMFASRLALAASLAPHPGVGAPRIAIASAEVRSPGVPWRVTPWAGLARAPLAPGNYDVRFALTARDDGEAVQIPPCAGRRAIALDGVAMGLAEGPVVTRVSKGAHVVTLAIDVSRYERRVACGEAPIVGPATTTTEGFGVLRFDSPVAARGGGRAVLYVPPGHDVREPSALLVGTHPWNGSIWTYASYGELVAEAAARDVLLLMPSGLGNSLYTADAEDEVLRALDAASTVVVVDPRRVSIWGASMGGAGATTIGFHHPDRFATVTSFFGDSSYDLATYVRSILPDARAARRVNALDVVDNARSLPTWLVHGEADATSPIRQSELLADALRARGFAVRFDRIPGMGHAGALVARFAAQVVDAAADARTPEHPAHVTYASVRPTDRGAYGVRIVRTSVDQDAFVDIERASDGTGDGRVHVHRADGVQAIVLARGALSGAGGPPPVTPPAIAMDCGHRVDVRWEPP